MAYRCLAEFLEELGQAGELVRVEAEVDPVLEVAEITDRVAQGRGPALLFGAVRGHPLPVLTNLLGTEERLIRALGGRTPGEIADQVAELLDSAGPEGWLDRIKGSPSQVLLRGSAAKTVRSGPCQQVVRLGEDVDLGELPALRTAREETHPGITAAQVFTTDAESGRAAVGQYEVRVLDRDRLALGFGPHDEPAALMPGYVERNARMPVAVAFGGDPAGLLAAMAPLPPGVDVSALAGLLRGKARELVKCRTMDLEVPTDAEMVVEGHVDPTEPPTDAGPVCLPGGSCRMGTPSAVMHVTAVTHRANPIVPAMVPGTLPDETCVVRRALQQMFLPLLRSAVPDLVDYDLPSFGAARHWAFVSIRKTYAGQSRRVAHALWGLRQLMFSRILVILDEGVDVHQSPSVWAAVSRHTDPASDVFFADGPPDPFDPTSVPHALARRMAVDATAKLPGERHGRPLPFSPDDEAVRQLVTDRWAEYGLGPDPSE